MCRKCESKSFIARMMVIAFFMFSFRSINREDEMEEWSVKSSQRNILAVRTRDR